MGPGVPLQEIVLFDVLRWSFLFPCVICINITTSKAITGVNWRYHRAWWVVTLSLRYSRYVMYLDL